MGEVFITRRGGGRSNFSDLLNIIVVGNEDNLPSNKTPNTLAIISQVKYNKTFVQENQPDSAENGDIWVCSNGNAKVLSIANDNQISEVYIKAVYQYIDSSWVEVIVYTYETGVPTPMRNRTYILDAGQEIVTLTKNRCTSSGGYLYLAANEDTYKTYCITENPVDLTGKSLLCAKGYQVQQSYQSYAKLKVWSGSLTGEISAVEFTTTEQIYSIDVSALEGNYYVGVYGIGDIYNDNTYTTKAYVSDIWLE